MGNPALDGNRTQSQQIGGIGSSILISSQRQVQVLWTGLPGPGPRFRVCSAHNLAKYSCPCDVDSHFLVSDSVDPIPTSDKGSTDANLHSEEDVPVEQHSEPPPHACLSNVHLHWQIQEVHCKD